MPEQLFDSMRITVGNIGSLLRLSEKEMEIAFSNEGIIIHTKVKDIVEKYDAQKVLFFTQEDCEDEDTWILKADNLGMERYHLLGILASAYEAIVQPHIDKIQNCLQETLSKISSAAMTITAMSTFSKGMYHVNISINESPPLTVCHEDPETLVLVVKSGLPQITKKLKRQ